MKKLLVLFAFLPFVAFAADDLGPVPGQYTDRLSYEIIGQNGAIVDSTVYERNVAVPYRNALILKYIRLGRCFPIEKQTFVDILEVLESGGDVRQLLK